MSIVLMETDDLVILRTTIDFKITFENHLRSVSRAPSQRHGILMNSWREFIDRLLIERFFEVLSCPFWSTILLCGAVLPIHHKLLDREVNGATFITGDVL